MITFESFNNKVEITSLKIYDDILIAGIGGFIYIFDFDSGNLLNRFEVFRGQKIHGFIFKEKLLTIFGGRKFSLLELNNHFKNIKKLKEWSAPDWILNLQWTTPSDIAIISSHNIIYKFNIISEKIIKEIQSEEKCILYSAFINGNDWENIIVFCGTVFKEIIIWSPADPSDSSEKPILHRLKGHNGVIFSVYFDNFSKTICSTSDDRSVRLWNVSNSNNLCNIEEWKRASITLKHTMFGHNARVWRASIVGDFIISIGEDSQICIWCLKNGKLLNNWKSHQGAKLWSMDCNMDKSIIAVGGGDGAICLWPLIDWRTSALYKNISIPENETARRLAFSLTNSIMVISEKGRLFNYDKAWTNLYEDKRLSNYALIAFSPCRKFLSMANLTGEIFIFKWCEYSYKNILIQKIDDGKIFSLHYLDDNYLVTCATEGHIVLWEVKNEGTLFERQTHILPQSKERWLTCVFLYNNVLICGDRGGSIYLFHKNEENPCQRFPRQHGSLGVTCISIASNVIISLGRDGRLCQYSLRDDLLQYRNSEKLPIKWPIAVYQTEHYPLLIVGFTEDRFLVWSIQDRRILFDIPCGGGHRAWDVFFNLNPPRLDFTYLRDSVIHKITYDLTSYTLKMILPSFHSHIVYSARLVSSLPLNNALISAGEDNIIRITPLPDCHSPARAVIRSHLGAVRALALEKLPHKTNDYFLVSAGARAEIKTWLLHVQSDSKVAYAEIASHMIRDGKKNVTHLPDPESRYMDISLITIKEEFYLLATASSDGIIRFFLTGPKRTDLKIIASLNHHKRCILKLAVIEINKKFILVSMATDGQAVLWNLPISELESEENEKINFEISCQVKLHQSGINGYDWIPISEKEVLFASGGDDSALVISKIDIENGSADVIFRIDSAHTSQITGLKFIRDHNLIFSTSIDQRITAWKWTYNKELNLFDCSFLSQYCCTVSDVQGFVFWDTCESETWVCIYGSGLEILKLTF